LTLVSKILSIKIPISIRNFILAGIAIFIGGAIYIFLRPSEYIFFNWLSNTWLNEWFIQIRVYSLNGSQFIPEWIIFSLPNGLWAFAYTMVIITIWNSCRSWVKYIWFSSIPILVLGFEFLQLAGFIKGTFCIQDIAFGLLGIFIGILIGLQKSKQFDHENDISLS
jgi:hypothetical protein